MSGFYVRFLFLTVYSSSLNNSVFIAFCRGSAVPAMRNCKQRDANSTTMMLIVVISLFLVVEIPLMVITALHTISSRYSSTISSRNRSTISSRNSSTISSRQQHNITQVAAQYHPGMAANAPMTQKRESNTLTKKWFL